MSSLVKPIFSRSPSSFDQFSPQVTVVTCFVYHGEHLLLLQRAPHCREGGKWCVPGGKVEPSENASQAMMREMREEVNWCVDPLEMRHLATLYERIPSLGDYILEVFHLETVKVPDVTVTPQEHAAFKWVPCNELPLEDLMLGQMDLYLEVYGNNFS